MANKLSEPKTQLIVGVVEIVGREVALELYDRTRQLESGGGMMIKNGERRRTPGGVFLQLLRDAAPDDPRIEERKVRHFFAQCNRAQNDGAKKRAPRKAFNTELEIFKKLSQERKKKEEQQQREVEMEEEVKKEEELLKPLPDILSGISKRFEEVSKREEEHPEEDHGAALSLSSSSAVATLPGGDKKPAAFVEPEAPPNSVERVERTLSAYDDDDDFLGNEAETEDIELF